MSLRPNPELSTLDTSKAEKRQWASLLDIAGGTINTARATHIVIPNRSIDHFFIENVLRDYEFHLLKKHAPVGKLLSLKIRFEDISESVQWNNVFKHIRSTKCFETLSKEEQDSLLISNELDVAFLFSFWFITAEIYRGFMDQGVSKVSISAGDDVFRSFVWSVIGDALEVENPMDMLRVFIESVVATFSGPTDNISNSLDEFLNFDDVQYEHPYVERGSQTIDRNLENSLESNTIETLRPKLFKNLSEEKINRVIPPEEKYVRRTAEEFAAGAKPARGGVSHRMKNVGLSLSPELHTAAKAAASEAELPFTLWMRAALRKALRDGMDPAFELQTPVTIGRPRSSDVDAEPS